MDLTPRLIGADRISLQIDVGVAAPCVSEGRHTGTEPDSRSSTRQVGFAVALGEYQTIALTGLVPAEEIRAFAGLPFVGDIAILGDVAK